MRIYGRSKLANILFTYELARRLEGTGIIVNCLHLGGVATGFGLNNGAIAGLLARLIHPCLRCPEEGARTQVYLASSPEVEGVSGAYFVDCKPAKSCPESYDTSVARRLWETRA
jgi:NAD(P)-dependent dehydrogenase (short-subunit alcohol dehydrogenase family)